MHSQRQMLHMNVKTVKSTKAKVNLTGLPLAYKVNTTVVAIW